MDKKSQKKTEDPRGMSRTADSIMLLAQFQAGESRAAVELFDRYVTRLIALARSRLSNGLKRRVDPEDVVQSAYRSFFLKAAGGGFEVCESGDLWRLLAQITLNKLRRQAERHTAGRRDFRRDEASETTPIAVTIEPTPEEAAALIEQLRLVTERLSAEHREVLTAFLQGESIESIAERISRSPRTVRRLLASARGQVERQLLDAHGSSETGGVEIPPLDEPLPYSDFRLEWLIGAGGMGKVYRATQLSTSETVAVKALRKDRQTEARAVRQFLHEAEVVRRLDHPGVIRVRGLGRFPSGGYFIVMDYVDGDDLQSLIDRRALPLAEAMSIVERVAEAVAHAHQAGVIHCDLKPANILLSAENDVVVTDFGFAQIIAGATPRTAIGGTPGYLAPELIASKSPPTPAADVYSLGRLLERVTADRPEPLQTACDRCLAQDPALRPQSTEAFLRLLRNATH